MVATRPPEDRPQPQRRPFLSALLVTYGSDLGHAVLSLVNVLIVSRALGPEGRGDVVFLTTVAFITSHLAAFGVHEANVNLAGAEPRLRARLATNSLLLATLLGGAGIAVVAGLVALFPAVGGASDRTLLAITLASIPMLLVQVYLRLLVQADYAFVVSSVAWILGPVVNVICNGLLAALGVISVGTAFGAWLGGQALGTLILVWYLAFRLEGFGRPDPRLAKRVLGFGVKSHAGRVMLLGNYRLDQWILGGISGSRELGLYSVAVAWAEALWFLPTAVTAVQRPDVVRASRAEAVRQTALAFRAAMLVTLASAVAIVVLAPVLVVPVFGEDFRGSIDDLRVLAAGAFGVLAMKLLGSALTGQRRPGLASVAIGIGFVSTIALDIALIPPYGGLGAAIASTVSYTVGGIAVALIFARALGARPRELVPRLSEIPVLWRRARETLRRRRAAPEPLAESTPDAP